MNYNNSYGKGNSNNKRDPDENNEINPLSISDENEDEIYKGGKKIFSLLYKYLKEEIEKKEQEKSFLNKKRNLEDEKCFIINDQKKQLKQEEEKLNDYINLYQMNNILFNQSPKSPGKKYINAAFDPENSLKERNKLKKDLNPEEQYLSPKKKFIKETAEIVPKFFFPEVKNKFIYKKSDNPKFKQNYKKLQAIKNTKVLSFDQKKFLTELFEEMNEIDINDVIKENGDKLDLILEVEKTCIFSIFNRERLKLNNYYKAKWSPDQVELIDFVSNKGKKYCLIILRQGLKNFVKYVEPLCNFYVSTLWKEQVGKAIKDSLSQKLKISFLDFKAKEAGSPNKKKISDLEAIKENTIIIDDMADSWNKESENVIISRYFNDEEADINDRKKSESENILEKDLFWQSYKNFYYYAIENDDWKNQKILKSKINNNYDQCFDCENLSSQKLQFIYFKNVVKQIYLLKFVYDIGIPLAIKMVRMNSLANMIFYLKYVSEKKIEILKELIKICGGSLFSHEKIEENEKVYLIVSNEFYDSNKVKELIKRDLEECPFFVVINDKYLFDSYYFMTNLKSRLNDSEYTYLL